MCTPSYAVPISTQRNHATPPHSAKRNRGEAEESGQGLKAITRTKRRRVNVESRCLEGLVDAAKPHSSSHARPKVGRAAPKRQLKRRDARRPTQGVENIPVLNYNLASYGPMRGDIKQNRSRSGAPVLGDFPGILNTESSDVDLPDSVPHDGTSGAAGPVLSGELAWCTPAFYGELRNIADSLVGRNQARSSGPSCDIPQGGPRVDQVLPGCVAPPAPDARTHRSGHTEEPLGSAGQAPTRCHLNVESSGSTSEVAKGRYRCPFADALGICCEMKPSKKRSSKGCKTEVSHSEKGAGNMRLTFGRPADVDRHVLSVHMKVYVHCKRHRGGGCVPRFARFDGFQRHLRDTCIKEGERADLEKEVMKQLQVTNPEDPRIDREICRRFAFIPRPCYQSDLFKKGLSVLRVPKTALLLEREWRANVEDIRQCKCCEDLTDEEKDAIPLSIAPECLRSQPGSAYRDGPEALGGDDDRLLPEEEEGVNEEPIPDLSGHASNLDVGPVYSTIRLPEMHSMGQEFPALDLYDLGEQESHKCSSRGHGEALADHWDETFQTTDSGNVIDDPAGNPHELETQPWYMDFGAEAIDPNATWLGSS